MKIEEYLKSIPQNIMSGEDVHLSEKSIESIFNFVELDKNDIFYHLGCGDSTAVTMAVEKYHVKKAVGIDSNQSKVDSAKKIIQDKKIQNCEVKCNDVLASEYDDATVILFWFNDQNIIEKIMPKFEKLNNCKIVTIWGPLPGCLPDKVDFPYILNKTPFKKAKDLSEQLLSIFGVKCVDFVTAWEYAERYTKALAPPGIENDRFLTIIQTLVIWINANNLGVTCGEEMPPSIKSYIEILENFFNIEVNHLIEK